MLELQEEFQDLVDQGCVTDVNLSQAACVRVRGGPQQPPTVEGTDALHRLVRSKQK